MKLIKKYETKKKKIFKNLIKESLNLAWIMSIICSIQLIKQIKKNLLLKKYLR